MERRDSSASDETLISLQQIDPSPIDSSAPEDPSSDPEKQLPDLPSSSVPRKDSNALGLSGSGHSAVYYCIFISLLSL
jgi:hypothetical protein